MHIFFIYLFILEAQSYLTITQKDSGARSLPRARNGHCWDSNSRPFIQLTGSDTLINLSYNAVLTTQLFTMQYLLCITNYAILARQYLLCSIYAVPTI